MIHTKRLKENDDYVITIDAEVFKQEKGVPVNKRHPHLGPRREQVAIHDLSGTLAFVIPVSDKNGVVTQKRFKLDEVMADYFPKK